MIGIRNQVLFTLFVAATVAVATLLGLPAASFFMRSRRSPSMRRSTSK